MNIVFILLFVNKLAPTDNAFDFEVRLSPSLVQQVTKSNSLKGYLFGNFFR